MQQQITTFYPPFEHSSQLIRRHAGIYLTAILSCLFSLFAGATAFGNNTNTICMPGDTSINATICANQTYLFDGQLLNTPGVYTATYTAEDGSDSTVTLTLFVLPIKKTTLNVGICDSSFYVFFGDTLRMSGSYPHTLTAANGCDSIVTLKLNVAPFFDIQQTATICAGSEYVFHGDTLSIAGVYVDSLQAAGGCDSTVTLTLNVLPLLSDQKDAVICAGDTLFLNGLGLTEPGVYEFILEGSNGCDSIFTFNLTVLPVYHTTITSSICAGETFETQGDILTQGGDYVYVYAAQNGCDSTVTVSLTEYPAYIILDDATICEGQTFIVGTDTLSVAGVYKFEYSTANGCDSTVILQLSVLPVEHTDLAATICNGNSYTFDGQDIQTAGTYTAVYTSANGCDSTVVLTLEVLPTQQSAINATICDGSAYEYNGQALSAAGSYEFIFEGANGCDSTVTINLTVLPNSNTALAATICDGETYSFNGLNLTESGQYTIVLNNINGCDSTILLQLTVLAPVSTTIDMAICEGAGYIFGSDTLTAAGAYTATFTSVYGCDSIVTLNLSFVGIYHAQLQAAICMGESYTFNGQQLTQSGDYAVTYTAIGGCDSTIDLSLTVLPLSESITNQTICAGKTLEFNGLTLDASGTYTIVLTGSNGCDSVATLNLTVLPLQQSNLSVNICEGESYALNGLNITESGSYTATLPGSNGCDSTVVLDLTVTPLQSSNLDVTVCDGDSYDYNGQLLADEGNYTYTYAGANGCDSIVNIHVTVLPLAHENITAIVCDGGSYNYNGETITQSGIYQFVLDNASVNGCDSIVSLYLIIFPAIPPTQVSATICEGQSYDFNGMALTSDSIYVAHLPSETGCDSTIILDLTVIPGIITNFYVESCDGDTGIFITHLTSIFGCDSTVIVTVTVYDFNVSVQIQNGTLTALHPNATAFQWINCDTNQPITGATDSSYTPTISGFYAVAITQNNCTRTSPCLLVEVVGTREPWLAADWSIQPNPAVDHSTLQFNNALESDVNLGIFDGTGRLYQNLTIPSGSTQFDIDLSGMPQGLLWVRLAQQGSISTKPLTKMD
jgi:Tfp pilus assembly major pilin PilA